MGLFDTILATEGINDSPHVAKNKEVEATVYARITKPQGLTQASGSEQQEQAEIKIDKKRKFRVRKTTREGQAPVYELTVKIRTSNTKELTEVTEQTQAIPVEVYETIKSAVPNYQTKTRYYFNVEEITVSTSHGEKQVPIKGLVYEVDVYINDKGQVSDWCKIDLELQDFEDRLKAAGVKISSFNLKLALTKLPFRPADFIVIDSKSIDKNNEKLTQIYEHQFLRYNRLPGESGPTTAPLEHSSDPVEPTPTPAPAEGESKEPDTNNEEDKEANQPDDSNNEEQSDDSMPDITSGM